MTEVVLGPPGTGKTRTMISVVQEEVARGVAPGSIGYVSFTRRAADEAAERACEAYGLDKRDRRTHFPWFSTIHSICFRKLGLNRSDVLDGDRLQRDFAEFAGVRISGRWSEDGSLSGFDTGDRIVFLENLARVRGIELRDQYRDQSDNLPWHQVERVARALVAFKREEGLMDYTDMLQEFVRSGVTVPLEVLVVDEAQDLSHLQWKVVEKLAEGARRVCVAGDDDQAIYRWSGADVDHLIDMPGDVSVLGQSYRVPPAIQKLSAELVRHMRRRRDKPWAPRTGDPGQIVRAPRFEDVTGCGEDDDVLVLARNTYVLREQVEPWLRRQGIEFDRISSNYRSVRKGLMDAIRTWEALRRGEDVMVGQAREMYQQMTSMRGVARGFKELPQLEAEHQNGELITAEVLRQRGGLLVDPATPWFDALDRLPPTEVEYLRAVLARRQRARAAGVDRQPVVRLSTIHGAKGGEADHVVLFKEMARRTHQEMLKNPEDEARVWYVAVTRARQQLTIVDSQETQACPWI